MKGLKKIESLLCGKNPKQYNGDQEQIGEITKLNEKLEEIDKKIYYRESPYVDEYKKWNQILEDLIRLYN